MKSVLSTSVCSSVCDLGTPIKFAELEEQYVCIKFRIKLGKKSYGNFHIIGSRHLRADIGETQAPGWFSWFNSSVTSVDVGHSACPLTI